MSGDSFTTKRLVTVDGPWYVLEDGLIREVLSRDALKGTDMEQLLPALISQDEIARYKRGPKISSMVENPPFRIITSSIVMREIATGSLSGHGIEFGAGTSPLSVPYAANVDYADVFDYEDLVEHLYPGQLVTDMLKPKYKLSFDAVSKLPCKNLDFIIACHVIEHVANPVKAIIDSLGKLKKGAKLVLIVPEKTKTFDKDRQTTTIDHLIKDYFNPDRNRDFEHFVEFYNVAQPPEDLSLVEQVIQENFSNAFPIHYHTFTHRSFKKLLKAILKIQPNSFDFWIRKARFTKVDIEFYVVITKK